MNDYRVIAVDLKALKILPHNVGLYRNPRQKELYVSHCF